MFDMTRHRLTRRDKGLASLLLVLGLVPAVYLSFAEDSIWVAVAGFVLVAVVAAVWALLALRRRLHEEPAPTPRHSASTIEPYQG
jgi:membrane protein implicated in regulation of membrane protease activity